MRQTFLLDENILYHAIRGVDKHDKPDSAAAELLRAIATICHGISVHSCVASRYERALKKLREQPPRSSIMQDFIKQLLYKKEKRQFDYSDLPALPSGVQIPREDEEIVQAALISHPIVVTADSELEDAIKSHPALGLRAMDAHKALEFAKSERS